MTGPDILLYLDLAPYNFPRAHIRLHFFLPFFFFHNFPSVMPCVCVSRHLTAMSCNTCMERCPSRLLIGCFICIDMLLSNGTFPPTHGRTVFRARNAKAALSSWQPSKPIGGSWAKWPRMLRVRFAMWHAQRRSRGWERRRVDRGSLGISRDHMGWCIWNACDWGKRSYHSFYSIATINLPPQPNLPLYLFCPCYVCIRNLSYPIPLALRDRAIDEKKKKNQD
ncbi:hypothetical protein K445DRAFT_218237 [Daldinia sp. EC12]|nr:hypothetical protein K445DRAFT_218237 [Daldinia sp. EC12]